MFSPSWIISFFLFFQDKIVADDKACYSDVTTPRCVHTHNQPSSLFKIAVYVPPRLRQLYIHTLSNRWWWVCVHTYCCAGIHSSFACLPYNLPVQCIIIVSRSDNLDTFCKHYLRTGTGSFKSPWWLDREHATTVGIIVPLQEVYEQGGEDRGRLEFDQIWCCGHRMTRDYVCNVSAPNGALTLSKCTVCTVSTPFPAQQWLIVAKPDAGSILGRLRLRFVDILWVNEPDKEPFVNYT